MKNWKNSCCLLVVVAAGLWCVGCEKSDDNTRGSISVYPSSVWLTGVTNAVTLTADVSIGMGQTGTIESIAFPLEWSVENPEMGHIVSHSGSQAVYAHTYGWAGGNAITVKDGYGREGIAVVSWQPEATPEPSE